MTNPQFLEVSKPSLNKRWFGYRTECGLLARFAILVNYECRPEGGVRAFIYATNQSFEGDTSDVLSMVGGVLDSEFKKKLNALPPPKDRGFFTQPWQGELRVIADGELFYVPPGERENYIPPWRK